MGKTSLEAKRRYREKNREAIRAKGRAYAQRKAWESPGVCRDCGGPCLADSQRCNVCHCLNLASRQTGEHHGNWKGEDATYGAHHHWIKRWGTRTGSCRHCGLTPPPRRDGRVGTDWANVSGQYLRSLDDWLELCRPCHKKYDMERIIGP